MCAESERFSRLVYGDTLGSVDSNDYHPRYMCAPKSRGRSMCNSFIEAFSVCRNRDVVNMSWTFNSTIKGRYSLEACLRKFPFVCPSRVQPFARAHADRLTYVLCHLADRRAVFVSSETKWQLAEAARLLEEQMRLLEVEREESLSIGQLSSLFRIILLVVPPNSWLANPVTTQ